MRMFAEADGVGRKPARRDRRRGLRMMQQRPVKVFEPLTSRYYPGQTSDICSTGLRIEIPRGIGIGVGKVLHVHVGMNEAGEGLAARRGMVPARVVWCEREEGRGRVIAGLEFTAGAAAALDAA